MKVFLDAELPMNWVRYLFDRHVMKWEHTPVCEEDDIDMATLRSMNSSIYDPSIPDP